MKFRVISEVNILGLKAKDEYIHEFDDGSNVFGRVLAYHERMHKVFPNCDFRLIKATEIKEVEK